MAAKRKKSPVQPKNPAPAVDLSLVLAPSSRLSRGRTRNEAIMPVAPARAALSAGYVSLLADIKEHLAQARLRTVLAANVALTQAYWQIGQTILARQEAEGWGAKVIDRLSVDLREAFPDMGGLSPRNLLAMKLFAKGFPKPEITQQPVAKLPWGHILLLLQKVKSEPDRLWYIGAGIVELKAVPFEPGFAGQMNFYLSAVDDLLRHPEDQPTIGLLLCKSKTKLEVEYALRGLDKSIAVSDWKTHLTETLPGELQGSLPTVAELEAELTEDFMPSATKRKAKP